jgi:hypothetical protein
MCIGKCYTVQYTCKITSYYVQDAASLEVPSPYVKVYLVESTFGRNTRDMYSKKKTRFVTPKVEFIKKIIKLVRIQKSTWTSLYK